MKKILEKVNKKNEENNEKNVFYKYESNSFVRLVTSDEDVNLKRTMGFNMKVFLSQHLLNELRHHIKRGNNEFEILENEIFLRGDYTEYVTNRMYDFQWDFEDEDNEEAFNNEALYNERCEHLATHCRDKFFIKIGEKLFTSNIDNLKIFYRKDKKSFMFQITKEFKNLKKSVYFHKVDTKFLSRLGSLIQ